MVPSGELRTHLKKTPMIMKTIRLGRMVLMVKLEKAQLRVRSMYLIQLLGVWPIV